MPIYHFSAQILGRAAKVDRATGKGRPGSKAVAAAAYRSGERLVDNRHGETHDYSGRKGIAHAEIMTPENAPQWLQDREALWNTVEAMEKRADAQLAREINIALPHELNHEQRVELVREFVQTNFVSRGMVADVAWHDPVAERGDDRRNFHAHIMLTLRRATPNGLDPVKTREWNSADVLDSWRGSWAAHVNAAMREAGRKERVDHRTLAAQRAAAAARGDRREAERLNRAPEIHIGPKGRKSAVKADRAPPSRTYVRSTARPVRGGFVSAKDPAKRQREVNYTRIDRSRTRVDFLSNLLLGNNEKAKARVAKTERQMARLQRKWDYWTRQAEFKMEGAIRGGFFRFQRAQKAAADRKARERDRQRQEHAQRRAAMAKDLMRELEMVFAAARGGREAVLVRQREVKEWSRHLGRDAARTMPEGRHHGRVRER